MLRATGHARMVRDKLFSSCYNSFISKPVASTVEIIRLDSLFHCLKLVNDIGKSLDFNRVWIKMFSGL